MPPPLAVSCRSGFAPSNTFTVLPATALPVSVSVLSLVSLSPAVPLSFENDAIVGTEGGVGVEGGFGDEVG